MGGGGGDFSGFCDDVLVFGRTPISMRRFQQSQQSQSREGLKCGRRSHLWKSVDFFL